MKFRVGVISGDGIGPEIVKEAKKVLDKEGSEFGHEFEYEEILMGGCSIDATGVPLTDEAIEAAKASDAVLIGFHRWQYQHFTMVQAPAKFKTGGRVTQIEKGIESFANLRPAYLYEELKEACPLREDIIGDGFDMMIMGN